MAAEAISMSLFLIKSIINMSENFKEVDEKLNSLVQRVNSLEKPLQVLQASPGGIEVFSATLKRVLRLLDSISRFLVQERASLSQSKLMKFVKGEQSVTKVDNYHKLLDTCMIDLNGALQASEVANAGTRANNAAQATVDLLEAEKRKQALETIHKCVQCNQDFRESSNAEGSCKFHPTHAMYNYGKVEMRCCGKTFSKAEDAVGDGCQRGKHISQHHSVFPYLNYFLWIREQHQYEKEVLLSGFQADLEDGMRKWGKIGLRKDGKLFVRLGTGNFNLFLAIFSPEELNELEFSDDSTAQLNQEYVIGVRGSFEFPGELDKTTDTLHWFTKAEWIIKSGKVIGARLSAKALSSSTALVKEVRFKTLKPIIKEKVATITPNPLPKKSTAASKLKVQSKKPNFKPIPDSINRPQPPFVENPTENTGRLKLRLKYAEPMQANPNSSGFSFDTFVHNFMVINNAKGEAVGTNSTERVMILNMVKDKQINVDEACRLLGAVDASKTAPDEPVNILDAKSEYLVDGVWKPCRKTEVVETLPFVVGPKAIVKVTVKSTIDAPTKSCSWIGRAYVARLAPVTIRVTLEDMEGNKASTVATYHNPPESFKSAAPGDLFFLHCDDEIGWDRQFVRITNPEEKKVGTLFTIQLNSSMTCSITLGRLLGWGYEATKENKAEFPLSDLTAGSISTTAIVDLENKIVIALRFDISISIKDKAEPATASDTYIIPQNLVAAAIEQETDSLEDDF